MRADVLIVEDDPLFAEAIAAWLETRNLTTRVAATAEEAMAALKEPAISLVVLDLNLAGIASGFYVVEQVKRMPAAERPAVLVATGANPGTLATIDRSVVNAVFFKPIDLGPFAAYVEDVVRRMRAAESA